MLYTGFVLKGYDKKKWIVKGKRGQIKRWIPYSGSEKESYLVSNTDTTKRIRKRRKRKSRKKRKRKSKKRKSKKRKSKKRRP